MNRPNAIPRARRRGFTLLEVILATTALASITTLVAALWVQTRDWTLENASHHATLRLQRALNLLTEQWETRVLTVSLGKPGAPAVSLRSAEFAFVTTTPILSKEWPMARVALSIERTGAEVVGQRTTSRLVYTESPVTNPGAVTGRPASSAREHKQIVLLDGATDLRFEEWFDESSDPGASPRRARVGWFAVDHAATIAARSDKSGDKPGGKPAPSAPGAPPAPESKPSSTTHPPHDTLAAGRIVGVLKGETFAWQFLAEPSR